MATFELRPRSAPEIIDASFTILRQNYLMLITIAAIVQIPVVALQVVLRPNLSEPGTLYGFSLLAELFLLIANGAIVLAVSDIYLGEPASVGASLGRALPRTLSLFGGYIMRNIVTGFAVVLLVIPGFYVYMRLMTLAPVIMLEKKGSSDGYNRAWALGKDRAWATFVAMLLAVVLYAAIAITLSVLAPRIGQTSLRVIVDRVAAVFVYPLVPVTQTLLYYDLRVRKEAFDLEIMAKELRSDPPR